jgi:hypothetical protein
MNRRRQRTARGSATTTFAHANSKPVLYKALLLSGTKLQVVSKRKKVVYFFE